MPLFILIWFAVTVLYGALLSLTIVLPSYSILLPITLAIGFFVPIGFGTVSGLFMLLLGIRPDQILSTGAQSYSDSSNYYLLNLIRIASVGLLLFGALLFGDKLLIKLGLLSTLQKVMAIFAMLFVLTICVDFLVFNRWASLDTFRGALIKAEMQSENSKVFSQNDTQINLSVAKSLVGLSENMEVEKLGALSDGLAHKFSDYNILYRYDSENETLYFYRRLSTVFSPAGEFDYGANTYESFSRYIEKHPEHIGNFTISLLRDNDTADDEEELVALTLTMTELPKDSKEFFSLLEEFSKTEEAWRVNNYYIYGNQ